MKKIILISILITFCNVVYSQNQNKTIRTRTVKKSKVDKETISNLYHIETGKKISKAEFNKIINENGRIKIEQLYDKYGKVEKRFYNPDRTKTRKRSLNKELEIGELFPDFSITTFDGKKIELIDLKGKIIVIHFGLFFNNILRDQKEIEKFDSKISLLNKSSEVESLMFIKKDEFEILNKSNFKNKNFKLTSNMKGFMAKWNISSRPITLVINKKGEYIGEFELSEIEINKLLK